jgi:hypothetical protein
VRNRLDGIQGGSDNAPVEFWNLKHGKLGKEGMEERAFGSRKRHVSQTKARKN